MIELKPCPFCGGKAKRNDDKQNWGDIFCNKCGTHMAEGNMDRAIERWNTRTGGWQPIETAPKSKKVIDIYSKRHGRCVNYYRFAKNSYYPTDGGISIITDATHWQPRPEPPNDVN